MRPRGDRFSCVVVGGGPAGVSTALFLAHHAPALTGRILVVEKERYPREKFCAGAVGARAEHALASIGVRVDVPSVPISGLRFDSQGRSALARVPGAGRVVRRIEFDHALARIAVSRGIAVRDGVAVREVRVGSSGVTVETSEGELTADVVVGADGVSSIVRRALALPRTPFLAQAVEVDTESIPGDAPRDVLVFDLSRGSIRGYTWDFPTIVDGRELVCRGVYALKPDAGTDAPDIDAVLREMLEEKGLDVRSYRKKRYAERGYHRELGLSSRRTILVGEAAGIDPVTGEGIAQAILYGSVAGQYLARKIPTRDFFFDDFARAVRASSVGRDLLVRSSATELAYGQYRRPIERFLLETPEFLRIGLQHFSGQPWSRGALLRTTVRGALATARATLLAGSRPAS